MKITNGINTIDLKPININVFKNCIDLNTKCVYRHLGKICTQELECFINSDTNKCNLSIKPIGKKSTYSIDSIKTK